MIKRIATLTTSNGCINFCYRHRDEVKPVYERPRGNKWTGRWAIGVLWDEDKTFLDGISRQKKLNNGQLGWLDAITKYIKKKVPHGARKLAKCLAETPDDTRKALDEQKKADPDKWVWYRQDVKDERLQLSDRTVLRVLYAYSFRDKDYAAIPLREFTAQTGMNRKTVCRALAKLESLGYFERDRSSGGRRKWSRYGNVLALAARRHETAGADLLCSDDTVNPGLLCPGDTGKTQNYEIKLTEGDRSRAHARSATDGSLSLGVEVERKRSERRVRLDDPKPSRDRVRLNDIQPRDDVAPGTLADIARKGYGTESRFRHQREAPSPRLVKTVPRAEPETSKPLSPYQERLFREANRMSDEEVEQRLADHKRELANKPNYQRYLVLKECIDVLEKRATTV